MIEIIVSDLVVTIIAILDIDAPNQLETIEKLDRCANTKTAELTTVTGEILAQIITISVAKLIMRPQVELDLLNVWIFLILVNFS